MNRRFFLKGIAAVAATAPARLRAASVPPGSRLRHACIGVGGMGANDLKMLARHPGLSIAAICDVDAGRLRAAEALAPGARSYRDWRDLLAREGSAIDSINIAVPDHMHAAIALEALRAGKHVYCQKPLCHDVAEARALAEAAARAGVRTQIGTQHASGLGERMAVRHLRAGVIGEIRRVHLTANRPGAVERYRLPGPRPARGSAPPPALAWDLWLGTAPVREYAEGIYHPVLWRAWQDFGTGWSGDIGCHIFSAVFKALDPGPPASVVAEVQESWKNDPARFRDTWPQGNRVTWSFPGNARTGGEALAVEWVDGDFLPPAEVRALYPFPGVPYPGESAMFIGTRGALLLPLGSGPLLLPRERFAGVKQPELAPRDHYGDFVDACREGREAASPFAFAGPMTEAILLGTIAIRRPGERITWDAPRMRIPGAQSAEALLRRRYRDGWGVEGLG